MTAKSKVAEPYAEALFEIAQNQSGVGEPYPVRLLKALRSFGELLKNPELQCVFTSPLIKREERRALLEALLKRCTFEASVGSLMGRFLKVLCDHDRFAVYHEICEVFEALWDRYLKLSVAIVSVAAPLSEPQRRELKANLKQLVGKECTLEEHVQPDLLGGLRVEVEGRLYDMSVRGQLEHMRLRLKNAFHPEESQATEDLESHGTECR